MTISVLCFWVPYGKNAFHSWTRLNSHFVSSHFASRNKMENDFIPQKNINSNMDSMNIPTISSVWDHPNLSQCSAKLLLADAFYKPFYLPQQSRTQQSDERVEKRLMLLASRDLRENCHVGILKSKMSISNETTLSKRERLAFNISNCKEWNWWDR